MVRQTLVAGVVLALALAVAGCGGGSSGHHRAEHPYDPLDATTTVDTTVSAFCEGYVGLRQLQVMASYAVRTKDLALLQSTMDQVASAINDLANTAPSEIRAQMQQLASDAHDIDESVADAGSLTEVGTTVERLLLPKLAQAAPLGRWISDHCGKT